MKNNTPKPYLPSQSTNTETESKTTKTNHSKSRRRRRWRSPATRIPTTRSESAPPPKSPRNRRDELLRLEWWRERGEMNGLIRERGREMNGRDSQKSNSAVTGADKGDPPDRDTTHQPARWERTRAAQPVHRAMDGSERCALENKKMPAQHIAIAYSKQWFCC